MKKRSVFKLMSIIMVLTGCYAPERNCEKFKTGTFVFETYLNGEVARTTFVRNDSIEVDYYQGKTDSASIRWINNCEYIAKKINPESMQERKALHFKILSTSGDTYTFEYALVGETNKQQGTAKKID